MDSHNRYDLNFQTATLEGFILRSVSREWLNFKFGALSVPEWDAISGYAADYKKEIPILFATLKLGDGTTVERPASAYAGRPIGSIFPVLVRSSVNAYSTK